MALIFGFIVDIITFRTLNLTIALALLAAHLAIVAFSIIVLALPTRAPHAGGSVKKERVSAFTRFRSWIPVAQQYSMGNLLSAFLVLYSASGSLAASWPFFALLAASAVGNEALKLERYRLPFHTTLFFLNILLYAALLLPILAGSISPAVFLLALIFGGIVFVLHGLMLRVVAKEAFQKSRRAVRAGALAALGLLALLYFTNIIPPIPLSMKQAAFYHRVERAGSVYVATDEERSLFRRFFDISGTTLRLAPGEDAFLYTAVFAPARLGTNVTHHWERFDEASGKWVSGNVVEFPILGGRLAGYRAFSFTEDPVPGKWRVSVGTARGQTIGRAYLSVIRVASPVVTGMTELR